MQSIHSMSDYFQAREQGKVIDILPLRDFSAWLDYRVSEFLNWPVFHLTNLLLWMGGLYFLFKILELNSVSLGLALLIVAYCGVHPVGVNSVAWVTGRKHLLAAFFALLATYWWLKSLDTEERKWGWRAVGAFFLAAISHPIVGFWPMWAAYAAKQKSSIKSQISFLTCFAFIGIAILGANNYYYTNILPQVTGSNKLLDENLGLLVARIFVVGRYYYQLLIPFSPSVLNYDVQTFRSYIGLALLALSLAAAYRSSNRKYFVLWGLFCLFPILPVTIRLTNITGMDTYILTSLLGWGMLVATLTQILPRKFSIIILTVMILAFSVFSFTQAKLWRSDEDLWRAASAREPMASSLLFLADALIVKADPSSIREGMGAALAAKALNPDHPHMGYTLCKSIFFNSFLSKEEKFKLMKEHEMDDPWYIYCFAGFKAANKNEKEGFEMLERFWKAAPFIFARSFGDQSSSVVSDTYVMCKRSGGAECLNLYNSMKKSIPAYNWKEEVAAAKIRGFKLNYPPE